MSVLTQLLLNSVRAGGCWSCVLAALQGWKLVRSDVWGDGRTPRSASWARDRAIDARAPPIVALGMLCSDTYPKITLANVSEASNSFDTGGRFILVTIENLRALVGTKLSLKCSMLAGLVTSNEQ